MPKLHELLAVEGPLKSQADKTRGDLANTFEKKRHLFAEKIVTFIPNGEGAEPVREEQLDLQTTVRDELRWITDIWSKALNAAYQIAEANTIARNDVVLEDGRVLLANVPATALLELEKRAEEIRELVAGIPTLDPAKGFTIDAARGAYIYQAREDEKTRTKKVQKALVLYEATKEHPAQVKEISVDDPVGKIRTQEWSGLITPAEKADMLNRAEQVKRAIKQARSRANGVEVLAAPSVGEQVLSYVFNG
jgi:hypothetical protein